MNTSAKNIASRRLFGILSIVTLCTAAAWPLQKILTPADGLVDTERILSRYIVSPHHFIMDSSERTGYVLYFVIFCALAMLLSFFYQKIFFKVPSRLVSTFNIVWFPLVLIPAGAVSVFLLRNVDRYPELLGPVTILQEGFPLRLRYLLLRVVLFAALLLCVYLFGKFAAKAPKIKYSLLIVDILAVCFLLYLSKSLHLKTYFSQNNVVSHYSTVFNPIHEAANGRTLAVDFHALYGFYAYIFVFVQRLFFGKVTPENSALLFTGLTALSNILLYFTCRNVFKKRSIALVVASATIFLTQIFLLNPSGIYYQYFPLRVIIPVGTLFFISTIQAVKNKKLKWILYIAAALWNGTGLFLWNIDSGLVSCLALAFYAIFSGLIHYGFPSKKFFKHAVSRLAILAGAVLAAFAFAEAITFFRSGSFFDVFDLFWSMSFFASEGFFMLWLPKVPYYLPVIIVYSISAVIAIFSLFRKNTKTKDLDVFGATAAVLGLGAFIYYLGRSHYLCLFGCSWPAFLSLAYITYKLFLFAKQQYLSVREYEKKSVLLLAESGLCFLLVLCVSFGMFFTGSSLLWYKDTVNWRMQEKKIAAPALDPVAKSFVEKHQKDSLFVLDVTAPLYLGQMGIKNDYIGAASIDLFFKEDLTSILTQLETYHGRFLFNSNGGGSMPFASAENRKAFMDALTPILESRYVLIDQQGAWLAYDSAEQ